jgi:hypothetical protein
MRTAFPLAVVALVLFALPGVGVFAADLLGYGPDVNRWLEDRLGVSHRLALSIPAAVALFCVPVVIVLLYFLRLRRKPVPVSSTFLWKKSVEDLHVNRLMQWLRRNVLLLLQLLAAFALIYAVMGPRLHAAVGGGRHYILVIDNSASMSATDVPPSRLEWAKAEALKEIDAATDADSGMVIVFNRTAEIRQSYTTNRDLLRAAVRDIRPSGSQTRFDEALNLAASRANPDRSTENEAARPDNPEVGKERTYVPTEGLLADVHLYSDGGFPAVPGFSLANLNLSYHRAGVASEDGASNNIGVVRLDVFRGDDPRNLTVTASVRNYRANPTELTARLEVLDAADRVVKSYAQVARPAGKSETEVTFQVADVPETADLAVRVSIDPRDHFALDDTAWLVPGVARKARILVFMPENPVLRQFLDSPSTRKIADVTRFTPDRLADSAELREGKFDLVIFDRCAPDEMPRANTLFVGAVPPGVAVAAPPINNPRVTGWLGSHPLMSRLRGLYDVEIAEALRVPVWPPKTDRLMESDGNLVLIGAVPRPPFTDVVLTFPVYTDDGKWNTLWPVRPSFVLFLRNVLRSLGGVRDALADEVTRPGDVKVFPTGAATKLTVTTPSGTAEELERGGRTDLAFAGTTELGLYAVAHAGERGKFAVNLFDPAEGDLAPRGEVSVGSQSVQAGQDRKQPRELWKLAVLLGLAVLLAEWWLYNRRVSV